MSKVLHIYDEFKIQKNRCLHTGDYENLSLLYLPLIGIDAFGLFLALQSLPVNESFSHKTLYDLLNLQNIQIINNAKEKLEAIGLLDTFYSDTKGFIYFLKEPLQKENFHKDLILSHSLLNQVGEQLYEKLFKQQPLSLRGYKKQTKKFSDVFDLDTTKSSLLPDELVEKIQSSVDIEHNSFDFVVFKELIGEHFIPSELLQDEEFRKNLYRMSYLYRLDEEEMKLAIIKSIDVDKDFSYEVLSKNCRKIFQAKNKDKAIYFTRKQPDPFVKSSDMKLNALVDKIENMHPSSLLETLSGIKPSSSELKIVEDLLKNTKFSIGVINWMLLMVSSTKDGVMPSYNYFEKIANTWARAKVETLVQAIEYTTRTKEAMAQKPVTKDSKQPNKKQGRVPEWYDQYEKQLDDYMKGNEEKMSEEEIEKTLEEAKRIFG